MVLGSFAETKEPRRLGDTQPMMIQGMKAI